jgi:hypothetical protein
MGRSLSLQDDTFLDAMAWFPHTDKAGLSYWFLDPTILDVLEQGLGVDLSAFRHVADDDEGIIRYGGSPEEVQRAQLHELRQNMDAAWQPPDRMATAIVQVLAVIDTPQGFPANLIAAIQALPITTTIYPEYCADGELAEELRNLQAMVRHAMLRGATRVRLLHR